MADSDIASQSNEDIIRTKVSRYIKETIQRFLPVGTLPIIYDENFCMWDQVNTKPKI